ncbi:MAG: phosphodiester glycosidase family protein [Clostridia bacterium]|nr:phosphodiester glycosidase family protein [Clostridia bacterium]
MRICKRLLAILILLTLCLASAASAKTFRPLPWTRERSLIRLKDENFLPDHGGYHDASMDIRVETVERFGTPVMLVRVKLADASQFRTAVTGVYPSKRTALVSTLAQRCNAVLAINGDNCIIHNDGIVYRNGVQLRLRPNAGRDTLIVDDEGNFTILAPTPQFLSMAEGEEWWKGFLRKNKLTPIHVFCFGPGLVIDGKKIESTDVHIADIAKDTPLRRMAIGQTGPLEYLIIATQGPEDGDRLGLTIMQMAELCAEFGCIQAYNLDGGISTAVVLRGERINSPDNRVNRTVGDCIWFASLDNGR